MKQQKTKKEENNIENLEQIKRSEKIRNQWFVFIIIVFSLVLYGNSSLNHYCLDDYHVTAGNEVTQKGIKAIPEIFTTLYAVESGLSYGYRPLVRISFALDHQFFGNSKYLPYISHFINVILYMLAALILLKVLQRMFKKFNPFFPFIITLLFMAHPTHTEVVASLKNRDEILNMIFCFLALGQFLRWADYNKVKYLLFGSVFYMLALLSKTTALSFLLIFPLSLYFFTEMKPKRLWEFSIVVFVITILAAVGPFLFLPEISREIRFMENPIVEEGFFNRMSTGFYILLLYLKKLIYPYPLLYYYGYDVIPVKSFTDVWVILSVLIYVGMFVYAIFNFRKKHILSYAVLFYLISIAMFANMVYPVPGIIGDRFLLYPSLAFSIVVTYFIFYIFRGRLYERQLKPAKKYMIIVLVVIILIPYTAYTIDRNRDWRSYYSLYKHDIKYLERSVKAHDLLATELMHQVSEELKNKAVNVVKFLEPTIKQARKHYELALKIYPEHYASYNNLGTIYSKYYKEYKKAIPYYENAIRYKSDFPNAYFNLGYVYDKLGMYDTAIYFYNKCYLLNEDVVSPIAAKANAYFKKGDFEKAVEINRQIIDEFPESDAPYINIGSYYWEKQDTLNALRYFEMALDKGDYETVSMILYSHYREKGDWLKANMFYQRAQKERAYRRKLKGQNKME